MDAGGRQLTRATRNADSSAGRALVLSVLGGVLVALCFVVPFVPGLPHEELLATSVWGVAVLASSAGWGTLIAQKCAPGERIGLSLRAVWGASAFAFVGGLAAMVSGLSRALIVVWMVAGAILLARSWFVERTLIEREARVRLRATALHLPLAAVMLFLAAAVLVRYLGGASDISSNPYDDDVAYYPFAKQLLEHGTLIEPFSFRRMSTLGGQALFHAQLLIRVPPLHLNVFDRGMCITLAAGLIASHRVRGRLVPVLARLAAVSLLVVLPNTSINSASYYSGLAFFLAFFQTLDRVTDDSFLRPRAAAVRLLPLALIGAALCTLRQNYQATVALTVVVSYALAAVRLRHRALRAVLVEGVTCAIMVAVLVAPWLVLLYRSNDTFLFPLMKGTFRAGVAVQSQHVTSVRLVRFFTDIWLQPEPIYTLPLFMLVGLAVHERSARRPLAAQWLAGFVSLVMLAIAFSLADYGNLARYDYGFLTASAFLTWLTIAAYSAERTRAAPFTWAAPLALLVFAMFAPLVHPENRARTKKMFTMMLRDTDEMMRRTSPPQVEPPIAAVYHRIQEATPKGARLLIMLDEPYFLSFSRNEIWNLDMPGTASPAPGIPCFQGAEPVADYFRSQGIRYVAFVRPDRSTFLYRHNIWEDHLYDRDEVWRVYAPYMVDVMENLVALAGTRANLHDEAGMILLDLEQRK